MAVKITHDLLMRLGACKEHRDLFAETFPDGAEVNEENLQKALDAGLNLHWCVWTFFRHRYSTIFTETEQVMARMNVRRTKLAKAQREERGKWSRFQAAWNELRREQERELNAVAKDIILRYWAEDYGGDVQKHWYADERFRHLLDVRFLMTEQFGD